MLRKAKKKILSLIGVIVTSILGVYITNSFSKHDFVGVDKAFADIPTPVPPPSDAGGGGGSDDGAGGGAGGGADCCGY